MKKEDKICLFKQREILNTMMKSRTEQNKKKHRNKI